MAKKNAFNTVTPLSKFLAMVLFIALPFLGFYLGKVYQDKITHTDKSLLAGGNYLEDWITYSSNKFNYKISFPATYTLEGETEYYKIIHKISNTKFGPNNEAYFNDSIEILAGGNDCNFHIFDGVKNVPKSEDFNIDGAVGKKWIGVPDWGPLAGDIHIVLKHNSTCYTISAKRDQSNLKGSEENINRILSTLKFSN